MASKEAKLLLKDLADYSQQKAINDLLESGVNNNFIAPMFDIFKNSIINKSSAANLIDELKKYTLGNEDKLGTLERYVGQVNSDTVTQYVANYSTILTEDLGLQFYLYSGNIQRDSRIFCKERAGNYYHKKEIEAWANSPWVGKIEGTDENNIFTYRGGWRCEHYIIAVSTVVVPEDVLERNIANGNYKPSEEEKKELGIE